MKLDESNPSGLAELTLDPFLEINMCWLISLISAYLISEYTQAYNWT